MTYNVSDVIHALFKNKMMIRDDHNGKELKIEKLLLQILPNGSSRICPGFSKSYTPYFSVNPLYVDDDGSVHLDRAATGGVIDYTNVLTEEEAINQYNEEHLKSMCLHDMLTWINIQIK